MMESLRRVFSWVASRPRSSTLVTSSGRPSVRESATPSGSTASSETGRKYNSAPPSSAMARISANRRRQTPASHAPRVCLRRRGWRFFFLGFLLYGSS